MASTARALIAAQCREFLTTCWKGREKRQWISPWVAIFGRRTSRQHGARVAVGLADQRDRGRVQLVEGVLDLGKLALAPVEAREGRPVRAVLGHVSAREVEKRDEELAGEERQRGAVREADLGNLARDDQLIGLGRRRRG